MAHPCGGGRGLPMTGLLLGAGFVALWASAFTAVRGLVPEWPSLWALALRFCLAAPILGGILLWRGVRWPGGGDLWRLAAMGCFGTALYLAAAWSATALLPTGLVALLSATAPLFVAAGEVLVLRRPLRGLAWLGLGLGWLGVAVLGLGRAATQGLAAGAGVGVLLGLLGAVSQAVGMLVFAPARDRLDPWTSNAVQSGVAAALLLGLAASLQAPPLAWPSPVAGFAMAWSVLAVGVGGYALYFIMLRRLQASTAAALQLLAPPLAALFGWALLEERLAWTDLLGGAVTLAGLALLFRARR